MDKIKPGNKQALIMFIILIISVAFSSCEKYRFSPPDVDPNATWSLSNDIQPIFNSNCITCHGGAISPDLRETRSYNSLTKGEYVKTPAESSRLYTKLNAPDHQARTTPVEKLKILYWIQQGAKDN
ncbi:MAG TPA: hypothetical protein VHO50_05780 [Bacteroidales bacterium]|nr:hypothetical protein [Bacteroidales bacterium]